MKRSIVVAAVLGVLTAGWVCAQEKADDGRTAAWLTYGGDIRIRQAHFDEIPIVADPPGVTRGGENHFFRFRTRLWSQLDVDPSVHIYGRICNEFRDYIDPDNTAMDAMDEIVLDNLYLDLVGLFGDKIDLRVGRQDLIYGTGKLVLEGTPKDGSRTIYMDAARLRWRAAEKTSIDLFGIYNQAENQLVVHSQDRDLTGYDAGFNDGTESGGGLYVTNKDIERMPFEVYYLFKDESDWVNKVGTNQPGVEVHTAGFRLMPSTADQKLSASIELAAQQGEMDDGVDQEAYMVDAVGKIAAPAIAASAKFSAGYYMITGDDPETADKDEGWNPLWSRFPQYSELYVYAFDAEAAGRWSNVTLPHVGFEVGDPKKLGTKVLLGYMLAGEDDGPGDGKTRGWLGTVRTDFTIPISEKLLTKNGRLFGHLLAEVFSPEDYYNVDDLAHFVRWEISYQF